MKRATLSLTFALTFLALSLRAQNPKPVIGLSDERPSLFAFTGATIFTGEERLDNATLIIEKGKVKAVGVELSAPKNAVLIDCSGKTIYPSFIDAHAAIKEEKASKKHSVKGDEALKVESFWNPAIHPERHFTDPSMISDKWRDRYIKSGFGIVNVFEADGIMRGTSAIYALGKENNELLVDEAAAEYAFDKGSSSYPYPSSLMGAIALIRQTLYDALWYKNLPSELRSPSAVYSAINEERTLPQVFEVVDAQSILRAQKLFGEFQLPLVVKTTSQAFQVVDNISVSTKLITSLAFPKAMDVSNPLESQIVSFQDLLEWEHAPSNLARLLKAGRITAISLDSLDSKAFFANLKQSLEYGVGHDEALKALTVTPAQLLGVEDQLGRLKAGMKANFFIANTRFDKQGFEVNEHWTAGKLVFRKQPKASDISHVYNGLVDGRAYKITIQEHPKLSVKLTPEGGKTISGKMDRDRDVVALSFNQGDSLNPQFIRLYGKISLDGGLMDGGGILPNGKKVVWSAIKSRNESPPKTTKPDTLSQQPLRALPAPFAAYGRDSVSQQEDFVITNARLWTAADTGILEAVDIWIEGGKIKKIGRGFMIPSEMKKIDARGKNVTPGIIDEHSHIGISGGVNEGSHAVTPEVRVGDVINANDINIYRQLAGGVTTVQQLHGSANPIGGQSSLIKLRWGQNAEGLKFQNAPAFIKFALGENVKQSNWQKPTSRFPQTRMGVEQIMQDAFSRASTYLQAKHKLLATKQSRDAQSKATRRDLGLEALSQILKGERHITCHSYVQSEILMMMALADSLKFRINTFTHVLEGYKIADELAKHGASASTFSDWWAYKFEVADAIPYNAAIMLQKGVNVALNSDDAEMGRRLNQEAGKLLRYGGVDEHSALQTITINPAKMLHIDDRVGSIEVGKDADLVIWSDNPLSIDARVDQTIIEGRVYYSDKWNDLAEAQMSKQREAIIQRMLKTKGEKVKPKGSKSVNYHCETLLLNYMEE